MTAEQPPATPDEALAAALAEARAAEARSRRFLADAVHQLRTPLAGIRAAAENLLRGADPPDRNRLLTDVVREAARASRLMSSLLRIARLDEGLPLERAPCEVVALCADEVDRAWSVAPHLDFVLRADPLPDDRPELDANALREVLANLLDNARRFAVAKVEVLVRPVGAGVEIRVVDDGPGAPEGWEERIFERFVSAGDRSGSGLGLAIARELASAHGGDLTYSGGAFVLSVPVPGWPEEVVEALHRE